MWATFRVVCVALRADEAVEGHGAHFTYLYGSSSLPDEDTPIVVGGRNALVLTDEFGDDRGLCSPVMVSPWTLRWWFSA